MQIIAVYHAGASSRRSRTFKNREICPTATTSTTSALTIKLQASDHRSAVGIVVAISIRAGSSAKSQEQPDVRIIHLRIGPVMPSGSRAVSAAPAGQPQVQRRSHNSTPATPPADRPGSLPPSPRAKAQNRDQRCNHNHQIWNAQESSTQNVSRIGKEIPVADTVATGAETRRRERHLVPSVQEASCTSCAGQPRVGQSGQ